jgi:small conductance mechanosensitive channel
VFLIWSSALPGEAAMPLAQVSNVVGNNSSSYNLGWVELDSYDAFQIAAPSSALAQRTENIQQNLQMIRDRYLQLETPVANISTQEGDEGQPQVYVNGQYLMSITEEDARLKGTTAAGFVRELEERIPAVLSQAYEERQADYRRRQYILIGIALVGAIAAMIALAYASRWLVRKGIEALGASFTQGDIDEDQRHQLQDVRNRLLPIFQVLILVSTIIWAMGRFPETRELQKNLLSTLTIPIIVGIVVIVAFVGVRLTYAVVDRIARGMIDEEGFSSRYSRRTRLRISTLSSVIKNIAYFGWIVIGFLIALSITGINLGLLLASVGIIGLALSLAAQNLVKGAIQGFFIVLEDQFAIGDVVKIGDHAGLVEKLNLRITQLRDAEGRLITIPTSDITRVANYSLEWSRADLKIPVHYNADVNHMLSITRQVGEELQGDPEWNTLILEEPAILGVDDFGDSALIIRVWIKTQPMKQWDVSREYRRRFKQTLQNTDTEIPFPQRDVWLHPIDEFKINLQGSLPETIQAQLDGSSTENGASSTSNTSEDNHSDGKKHTPRTARTDAQPQAVPSDDEADEGGDGSDGGSHGEGDK